MVDTPSEPQEPVDQRGGRYFTPQNCLLAVALVLLVGQVWTVAVIRHQGRALDTVNKALEQLQQDGERQPAPAVDTSGAATSRGGSLSRPNADVEEAVELSRQAQKAADFDLAEIYLVNAISRSPPNVLYLSEYVHLVLNRPHLRAENLDRLASILQPALSRVPAADVKTVRSLLTRAEQKRTEVTRPDLTARDVPGEFAAIIQTAPPAGDNRAAVEHYVARLQALAAAAGPADAKLSAAVAAELIRSQDLLQILQSGDYVDGCLANLATVREENDLASERAVAIVRAAENALPRCWGREFTSLPTALRTRLDGYPGQIRRWADEIAKARSAPALAAIKELRTRAENAAGRTHEERCRWIEQALEEAREQLGRITSPEVSRQAQKDLTSMTQTLGRERKAQFHAYQRAALAKCADVFDNFLDDFVVSESDARKWFVDAQLAEIDQGLLSPEAARCLNDLLTRLFAELGPETLLACERDMGTAPKLRLEDF